MSNRHGDWKTTAYACNFIAGLEMKEQKRTVHVPSNISGSSTEHTDEGNRRYASAEEHNYRNEDEMGRETKKKN
jgi:hypothetical protein